MKHRWLALGVALLAGCVANHPTTVPEAASHPDQRYEVRTSTGTFVVDSIRVVGDSLTAIRPALRPGDPGTGIRIAATDVVSIRETHPDQVGLGLTVLAMAPLFLLGLMFAAGYGAD